MLIGHPRLLLHSCIYEPDVHINEDVMATLTLEENKVGLKVAPPKFLILIPIPNRLSAKLTSPNMDVIQLKLGVVSIFLSLCGLGWHSGYHEFWIFLAWRGWYFSQSVWTRVAVWLS